MNIVCLFGEISGVEVTNNGLVKFRVRTVVSKDRETFVPVCAFKLTQETASKLRDGKRVIVRGTVQENTFTVSYSTIVSASVNVFESGLTIL